MTHPILSPDGTSVARAGADGTVTLTDVATGATRTLYTLPAGAVHDMTWSSDGTHLLLLTDTSGRERFLPYALRLADATLLSLAPEGAVQARGLWTAPHALVTALRRRGDRAPHPWRLPLDGTPARQLAVCPDGARDWAFDAELACRACLVARPDGTLALLTTDDGHDWRPLTVFPLDHTVDTRLLGITPSSGEVLLLTAYQADAVRLAAVHPDTGHLRTVLATPPYDIETTWLTPAGAPQAALHHSAHRHYTCTDPGYARDLTTTLDVCDTVTTRRGCSSVTVGEADDPVASVGVCVPDTLPCVCGMATARGGCSSVSVGEVGGPVISVGVCVPDIPPRVCGMVIAQGAGASAVASGDRVSADTPEAHAVPPAPGDRPSATVPDDRAPAGTSDGRALAAVPDDRAPSTTPPGHDLELLSRDAADRHWLLAVHHPDRPPRHHVLDRHRGTATPLPYDPPPPSSARTEHLVVRAADGRCLDGYLTIPGRPNGALVLRVHGGPWSRDRWRYDAEAQRLAADGVAVLRLNYRGSTGYGRAFRDLGDGEWGGRMQQDLYDAVDVVVERGVAEAGRVAAYGGSYGGYAALLALTDPRVRCAVAVNPLVDLASSAWADAPYWRRMRPLWDRQIGWSRLTEAELRHRSPLHRVADLHGPALVVRGANDPRVDASGIEEFVRRRRAVGGEVEELVLPDDGHAIRSATGLAAFERALTDFLAVHLTPSSSSSDRRL